MGRICAGRCQHNLRCAGVAIGSDAVQPAVLLNLDVLRMAAPRTAVEVHQHAVHGALCLWDRAVFPDFRLGLAGPFECEHIAHDSVVLISHPGEHPEFGHVEFAVDQAIVA